MGGRLQGAWLPGHWKPSLQGPGTTIWQAWQEISGKEIVQPGLHLPSFVEDHVPACPGALQLSCLPSCLPAILPVFSWPARDPLDEPSQQRYLAQLTS